MMYPFMTLDDSAEIVHSEIAETLGKSEKAVSCRIPYEKGMYGAEYPTINALRIRKCRGKENQK